MLQFYNDFSDFEFLIENKYFGLGVANKIQFRIQEARDIMINSFFIKENRI